MTILIIVAAVVVTFLAAFVIVKYVPIKFRGIISLLLYAIAGYLVFLIYDGIMGPIRFNEEKKVRYAKVIDHLRMIRDAQEAHKTITGNYERNGDRLIKFIDTAHFAITNTRNVVKQVNRGTKWQPIMVEIEERVTDTTGYESVKEKLFLNRNYQNMLAVPGTDKNFEMNVGFIQKVAGLQVPVFEARIDKELILSDLDRSLVKQEREAIGGDEVKGAYLSVGSLEEVNSNGNWPPFYDKNVKQEN